MGLNSHIIVTIGGDNSLSLWSCRTAEFMRKITVVESHQERNLLKEICVDEMRIAVVFDLEDELHVAVFNFE